MVGRRHHRTDDDAASKKNGRPDVWMDVADSSGPRQRRQPDRDRNERQPFAHQENGELAIVGRRADKVLPGTALYRESRPRDYRRVFDLDPSIDTGRITAKMEQGILKLTLPKTEEVKPRRIQVTD